MPTIVVRRGERQGVGLHFTHHRVQAAVHSRWRAVPAEAHRTLPHPCARPIFALRTRHGRSGGAMIVRRYGMTVQSVAPNCDSRAMTEIGFQRTNDLVMPAEEFLERHERVDGRELTATAEGDVKDEAEQALLASLLEQLQALEAEVGEGHVLLVENQPGQDYPKTRDRTTNVIVAGQNRLYFHWTVDPPLKLGIYRAKGGWAGGAVAGRGSVLRGAPRTAPARNGSKGIIESQGGREMGVEVPAPYAVATHGESIVVARSEALDWARSAVESAGTLYAYAAGCEGARVLQGRGPAGSRAGSGSGTCRRAGRARCASCGPARRCAVEASTRPWCWRSRSIQRARSTVPTSRPRSFPARRTWPRRCSVPHRWRVR